MVLRSLPVGEFSHPKALLFQLACSLGKESHRRDSGLGMTVILGEHPGRHIKTSSLGHSATRSCPGHSDRCLAGTSPQESAQTASSEASLPPHPLPLETGPSRCSHSPSVPCNGQSLKLDIKDHSLTSASHCQDSHSGPCVSPVFRIMVSIQ